MRANHTVARPGTLDSAYDYVVAALMAGAVVVTAGAWLTGQLAGLLFRGTWPPVAPGQGLAAAVALPHYWSDPRQAWPADARQALPGWPGFAVASALVLGMTSGLITLAARRLAASRPQRGMASRAQLQGTLSPRAVVSRGAVIRPSLAGTKITLTDVGVQLGRAIPGGMPLAVSAEDSVAVVAAPRQGKTSEIIIPELPPLSRRLSIMV